MWTKIHFTTTLSTTRCEWAFVENEPRLRTATDRWGRNPGIPYRTVEHEVRRSRICMQNSRARRSKNANRCRLLPPLPRFSPALLLRFSRHPAANGPHCTAIPTGTRPKVAPHALRTPRPPLLDPSRPSKFLPLASPAPDTALSQARRASPTLHFVSVP